MARGGISEHKAKHLFKTLGLEELVSRARELSMKKFENEIMIYAPSFLRYSVPGFSNLNCKYPAISVTGTNCALNCEHCRGELLKRMIPATTPQKLFKVCKELEKKGARGCLISGGADERGEVQLWNFVDVMKKIKEESNLTLVVHTGMVKKNLASKLAHAKIDVALMDVIGDRETMSKVYHLSSSPEDFLDSMKNLKSVGVKICLLYTSPSPRD